MAYGARLESALGESPRGFESPILRMTNLLISQKVFFALLATMDAFARRTIVRNFLDTDGISKKYRLAHIDVNSFIASSVDLVGLVIDAHGGTLSGGLVEPRPGWRVQGSLRVVIKVFVSFPILLNLNQATRNESSWNSHYPDAPISDLLNNH